MFNFNDYKGQNVVMHCKTEREAKNFCQAMHEAGLKWCNDEPYINATCYDCGVDTCYYFNEGKYGSINNIIDDYIILEWSDYMPKFTKSDLQDGDFVVLRSEAKGLVNVRVGGISSRNYGWESLGEYNNDLTHCVSSHLDIIKVYRPTQPIHCDFAHCTEGDLVFDRDRDCPKVKEISIADLEKQYGCKVKVIK